MRAIFRTSYSDGNRDVFDLSVGNHSDYCRRHGYELLNVCESYTLYTDTASIRELLARYDAVVTIGADVIIQRMDQGIEDFAEPGMTLGPQFGDGVLNADLVIYTAADVTLRLLDRLDAFQRTMCHGQAAINELFRQGVAGIHAAPFLQIAAPAMNAPLDYSSVELSRYFAIHYHKMGFAPVPDDKAAAMRAALSSR